MVCRVENFPTEVQKNAIQGNQIPKVLIRSKQILEGIYTYMQSHPCYIIAWIKKQNLIQESDKLKTFIYRVFGRKELMDNPRAINTLTVIARHIFEEELSQGSLKAMTSLGRSQSAFRILFIIILES